jgi:hypothetical protein
MGFPTNPMPLGPRLSCTFLDGLVVFTRSPMGIAQLATRQPGIRGKSRAVHFQTYSSIEMDSLCLLSAFPHAVPPTLSSHGR